MDTHSAESPDGGSQAAVERGATDYLVSLQRIAASLASGNSLSEVLQQVVDAICDHTLWRLCWIYAMDKDGGFGEIVARRDRMEYTEHSPLKRWPFIGTPSLEALQRNELIAVPDVSQAFDYPALQESALPRGVVASAYVPLTTNDASGRPMMLCVQSGEAVLNDPSQLPFLKAVASLTSLAVSNAATLTNARGIAAGAIEAVELLSTTMEALSERGSAPEILHRIEKSSRRSVLIFEDSGQFFFVGQAPAPLRMSQEEWSAFLEKDRERIFSAAVEAVTEQGGLSSVEIVVNEVRLTGLVTRFGTVGHHASVVFTFGQSDSQHRSAATASALVHLRERLALEAQVELKQDVMEQILRGSYEDRQALRNRAAFVGLDIDRRQFLVVQNHIDGDRIRPASSLGWPDGLVRSLEGCHVYLLPGEDRQSAEMDAIVERLAASDGAIVTRSTRAMELTEIPSEWRRCLQTIELAQKVGSQGVVRLDDFGAYRVLLPALEREEITDFVNATIGPLLEESALGAELFTTAEVFIAAGGRFQEAARRLFIHVSTLRYRLKRINELLGKDISDEETRFEISLAIRMERLRRDRVA